MVFNSPTCLAKCERIPSVSFWPFPAFALLSFSRFVLVVLFWWFRFGRFVSVVSFRSFRFGRSGGFARTFVLVVSFWWFRGLHAD